eukprot:6603811-Prymnesium_polylepis.2
MCGGFMNAHDVAFHYPRWTISFGRKSGLEGPRKKRHIQTANKTSKKPAPKQRCGRDAVLYMYERQLLMTKISSIAEKAKRQQKQAKDLMAILGSDDDEAQE